MRPGGEGDTFSYTVMPGRKLPPWAWHKLCWLIPSFTIILSLMRIRICWSQMFCSFSLPALESFFKKDFVYLFLDRGEGRAKERERNINVWFPLMHLLLGTWPAIQACALTGNWTSNYLVHGPALNPLSHTSWGHSPFLNWVMFFFYCWVARVPNILWISVPYQIYNLQKTIWSAKFWCSLIYLPFLLKDDFLFNGHSNCEK